MTRFISMRQLRDRIGLSKTSIYNRINSGTFPRPVPIGPKRVVFIESEVEGWMRAQIGQDRKGGQSDAARHALAVKAVGSRRDRRVAP